MNPQTIKRTSATLKHEYKATNSLFALFHETGHAGHSALGIELSYDELLEAQENIHINKLRRGIGDPAIEKYITYAGQAEKHADSFAEAVLGSHTRLLSPYSTIGEVVNSPLSPYRTGAITPSAIRLGQSRPDLRLGLNLYIGVSPEASTTEQLVSDPLAILRPETRTYLHQQKLMGDAYTNTPYVIKESAAPLVSNPLEQPSVTNRIVESAQERQKSRRISE